MNIMRYNKHELCALASQTSQTFDREGVIIVKERQESFFRRSEGHFVRWFRLRGNLLFYLNGPEPWYEPLGVIVLGNHQVRVQTQDEYGHWPFQLVWENGVCYRMGTYLESERSLWLRAMESAPYETLTQRIAELQQQLNDTMTMIDLKKYRSTNKIINDFNEVPLCELSLSCDNLICNENGNPPSPFAAVFALFSDKGICVRYGCTEVVEKCSNPNFLRTIMFRGSDGITSDVVIRILVYDMRETVSQTGVAIGSVSMPLSHIQDAQRLRVPLLTIENRIVGFVTFNGWSLESANSATSPTHPPNPEKNSIDLTPKLPAHRRSQSLPPRMGLKLQYPAYSMLIRQNFLNPHQATYRFHSGLGGDITVHEVLAEPSFCYTMPLQLVDIFLLREAQLLETLNAFAEVSNRVRPRLIDIVSNHLTVMRLMQCSRLANEHGKTHSSAMIELQTAKDKMLRQNIYFKPSIKKVDDIPAEPGLEYVPVNLHLQRMWAHNDTLNKKGFHDIITVGAFTAHTHTTVKPGGLIKLLKLSKDTSTRQAEMTANSNRLDAEFERLRTMATYHNILVTHMDTALMLLHKKNFRAMRNSVAGVRENVKLILEMWNVEVTEEALSKVGWNKQRIDSIDAEDRRVDYLALQTRIKEPRRSYRSAYADAAILTVAALIAPSIAHNRDTTLEMESVLNNSQVPLELADTAPDTANLPVKSPETAKLKVATPEPVKLEVPTTDASKPTRLDFMKTTPAVVRTRSEIDLRRTFEHGSENKTLAASRTLSEDNLRRSLEHNVNNNQNPQNDRGKNGKSSQHEAEGKVASTSGGDRALEVAANSNGVKPAATGGDRALEDAASSNGVKPAATGGDRALEDAASSNGVKPAATGGDRALEDAASSNGVKPAATGGDRALEDAASSNGVKPAATGGDRALEDAASSNGVKPAATAGDRALEDAASSNGVKPAATGGDRALEDVASTNGVNTDLTIDEQAAGTSGNIDPEQAASTSGLSFAGHSGNIIQGEAASTVVATQHDISSSTASGQNDSRPSTSGKSNRGKARGSKHNRAPKTTKQARKEANKEALRLARGENVQTAEAAQFGRTDMRVDFQSATSLQQVTADNLFGFNKGGTKKGKKNRREPVIIDVDPAVRDYNMKFFRALTENLQKMLHKLFSTLNMIAFKGCFTPTEFEDSRIFMDLTVKLLSEIQQWLRMAHTAMRIDTESPAWTLEHNMLRTRRDICFSQAVTAAAAGVLSWVTTTPGEIVAKIVQSGLGPLLGFEGLLSMHEEEMTMWGDMVIAVEDLQTLTFKIVPVTSSSPIIPQVTGSRNALIVEIPVTGSLYAIIGNKEAPPVFTVTAVFFNIGINDKASLAEALGEDKPQFLSNRDNFERIFKYYLKYCQQFPQDPFEQLRESSRSKPLEEVMENLRSAIHKRTSMSVEILHLASLATRLMHGIRFTSCKSAKDRTGMSVSLEQATILCDEYHLSDYERKPALDIMRSEGCRRENTVKNIGQRKYAFTKQQVMALPEEYRPPLGSYGANAT